MRHDVWGRHEDLSSLHVTYRNQSYFFIYRINYMRHNKKDCLRFAKCMFFSVLSLKPSRKVCHFVFCFIVSFLRLVLHIYVILEHFVGTEFYMHRFIFAYNNINKGTFSFLQIGYICCAVSLSQKLREIDWKNNNFAQSFICCLFKWDL